VNYSANNIVLHDGALYRCLLASKGSAPRDVASDWAPVAAPPVTVNVCSNVWASLQGADHGANSVVSALGVSTYVGDVIANLGSNTAALTAALAELRLHELKDTSRLRNAIDKGLIEYDAVSNAWVTRVYALEDLQGVDKHAKAIGRDGVLAFDSVSQTWKGTASPNVHSLVFGDSGNVLTGVCNDLDALKTSKTLAATPFAVNNQLDLFKSNLRLAEISDATGLASADDKAVVQFDKSTSLWVPGVLSTQDLSDVKGTKTVAALTDGETLAWDPVLKAFAPRNSFQVFTKNLKGDPDIPPSSKGANAIQVTLENNNKEMKVWSANVLSYVNVISETEIKTWIAAGSLFQGVVNETTLTILPVPSAGNKGWYFSWTGASGYVVKPSDSIIGTDLAGVLLRPGDWLQVGAGGKYVHVPGDLLSKQRWRSLGGFQPYVAGSYEEDSIVISNKRYFRATRNITASDPAPGSNGSTVWTDITPTYLPKVSELADVNIQAPPNEGDVLRWSLAANVWTPSAAGGDDSVRIENWSAVKRYKQYAVCIHNSALWRKASDGEARTTEPMNVKGSAFISCNIAGVPRNPFSPEMVLSIAPTSVAPGLLAAPPSGSASSNPRFFVQYVSDDPGDITLWKFNNATSVWDTVPCAFTVWRNTVPPPPVTMANSAVLWIWGPFGHKTPPAVSQRDWSPVDIPKSLIGLDDVSAASAVKDDVLVCDGMGKWVASKPPYLMRTEMDSTVDDLVISHVDAGLALKDIIDRPPATLARYLPYLVSPAPAAAPLVGHANEICYYVGDGKTNNEWKFIAPKRGEEHYVVEQKATFKYDGIAWVKNVPSTVSGGGSAKAGKIYRNRGPVVLTDPATETNMLSTVAAVEVGTYVFKMTGNLQVPQSASNQPRFLGLKLLSASSTARATAANWGFMTQSSFEAYPFQHWGIDDSPASLTQYVFFGDFDKPDGTNTSNTEILKHSFKVEGSITFDLAGSWSPAIQAHDCTLAAGSRIVEGLEITLTPCNLA